jgi:Fe2+ transport system protein FeoA
VLQLPVIAEKSLSLAHQTVTVLKLTEFALNKEGIIIAIIEGPVTARLVEFGIYPGASVRIVTRSSFNGPLFLAVGESRIALRKTEAEAILVE